MVQSGQLERVPEDRAVAADWMGDARRHVDAATAVTTIDPSGAFSLAYDAARKTCAALLLVNGLRAKAVPGSHRSVIDAAAILVVADQPSRRIEQLDRMRRDRNRSEYGSRSFGPTEVKLAIHHARETIDIVAAITGL